MPNFAKSEIYISEKNSAATAPFVQISVIVLYCLHYTLQKQEDIVMKESKRNPKRYLAEKSDTQGTRGNKCLK